MGRISQIVAYNRSLNIRPRKPSNPRSKLAGKKGVRLPSLPSLITALTPIKVFFRLACTHNLIVVLHSEGRVPASTLFRRLCQQLLTPGLNTYQASSSSATREPSRLSSLGRTASKTSLSGRSGSPIAVSSSDDEVIHYHRPLLPLHHPVLRLDPA